MASPAPYLTTHKVSLTHGPTTLFSDLSFTIHPGERWGVVGPNGAGKSTLLRILSGETQADSGTVALRNGVRVAVVSQKFDVDPTLTVHALLSAALPEKFHVQAKLESAERALASHSAAAEANTDLYSSDAWLAKLSELQDAFDALSGVGAQNILQSALRSGGLLELADRPYGALSGGQQKRVQLLAALLPNPQLVLLDEPTNHLDVASVEWLEDFLLGIVEQGVGFLGFRESEAEPFAFVLVSHDRALLDTLVNRIVEIEAGEWRTFEGNFEAYSEQKLVRAEQENKSRDRMANLYRRELAWLRRGPAARTTKQTARIERAKGIGKNLKEKNARLAQPTRSEVQFSAEMLAYKRDDSDILVAAAQTLGEQRLVEFQEVTLAFPGSAPAEKLLCKSLTFTVKPRTRLALLGPNGCGKTTMLRAMLGEIAPVGGNILVHELTKASYFDQHRAGLDHTDTIRRTVCPEGEYVFFGGKYLHVMAYLERFLFWRFDADKRVAELSGGEQARLLLARLMLDHGNLLVLDEPTNDLDIPTLQTLEMNLADFGGGVIFTSHDRYFIQRVATHILAYTGREVRGGTDIGLWRVFPDLNQALENLDGAESRAIEKKTKEGVAEKKPLKGPARDDKRKLSWSEGKELETLEVNMAKLESSIASLTTQLDESYGQGRPLQETKSLAEQLARAQADLKNATLRWEELFEKQME
ncbi:MAG: ABC-F family ATP-binding cassette domain-containing protein [Silvanigrellales bacterium]|nr:ABC-F family ATP-binding cassette domain-containing protein [Silvanigrellales bacterium]